MQQRPITEEEIASLATIRSNIARLDALDQHETKEQYGKILSKPSPCGNKIFFGGGSDATVHGKKDVRNVEILAFDSGPTKEQIDAAKSDPKGFEQYLLNMEMLVAASEKSVSYTESNVDALLEQVPFGNVHQYTLHSVDNATSAVKEGRQTIKLATQRTLPGGSYIHGVEVIGKIIRDSFHIFQLQCKYFSLAVLGDTDGDFNQLHHRAVSHLFLSIRLYNYRLYVCTNPSSPSSHHNVCIHYNSSSRVCIIIL